MRTSYAVIGDVRGRGAMQAIEIVDTEGRPDSVLTARAKSIGDMYKEWMCHGDFTLENCIYDQASNKLTVIDWEFVRGCGCTEREGNGVVREPSGISAPQHRSHGAWTTT